MTPDERANIEGALAFLERTGAHKPGTAASAYVEHVPILLNEIDIQAVVVRHHYHWSSEIERLLREWLVAFDSAEDTPDDVRELVHRTRQTIPH